MAAFSWQQWLNRLFPVRISAQRRSQPVRLGSHESLESRTLLTGISLVQDINPGPNSGLHPPDYSATFLNADGTLFFLADDGTHGNELWKTNGTTGGTALVADLTPGADNSYIYNMITAGGKLFFEFNDGFHGRELWVSDGTEEGTKLLKDINPNDGSGVYHDGYAIDVADVNGTLYFLANDVVHGKELWKTNGTEAGTVMVADLTTGNTYSAGISNMTASGDKLFFVFDDGTTGKELWTSNGTEAGTKLVKDIKPGTYGGLYDSYYYQLPLVDVNGTLYFLADDGNNGRELWRSNGLEAGTVMVKDLTPGGDGSYIYAMTKSGNKLFFVFDDGPHGYELWSTDGTPGNTDLVKDINPSGDSLYSVAESGAGLVDVNGTLYFVADDGAHGNELWKSNGTAGGTVLVADLTPGTTSSDSYIFGLTAVGNKLYFGFDDGSHGLELWQSNGTAAGTVLVQDLNPTGDGLNPVYSGASAAAALNGALVFVGDNGQTGAELFRTSDGDPQGPTINPQTFSIVENAQNGAVVGTVVASNQAGGALQYSITGGNTINAFAINSSTGQITVVNGTGFDFETAPSYALTVQVKNATNQTATATITVNLTDVNEAPVLTPATFDLDVNSSNGAAVGTVTATDPDFGQQLSYSITNGNTSNAFAIDPATGAITVANAAALDLNVNPVFHLSVEVTDNGVPPKPAITTVTINLFDPNDQNDVPVLALNGSAATFVKKSPAVKIAPNITVVDPDQSAAFRLGGGTLTVSIDLATKKNKKFDTIGGLTSVNAIGSIVDQGTVSGRFQIIIQLNDAATAASVQNYLRSLTFTTKGAGLKKATRTVQAQVADAAGAGSNTLTQTINVLKKAAPAHR